MKRAAFFGGSFDPVHHGHLAIAEALYGEFDLDEFVFIPAFHAPHKLRLEPTSAYHRYAMLCLATMNDSRFCISKMELEMPERPYSVETLERLKAERPDDQIFFVMGADSWMDITKWKDWESVLSLTNHIVVTRPDVEIEFSHVPDDVRARLVDLRDHSGSRNKLDEFAVTENNIYVTDLVNINISATEIRRKFRMKDPAWQKDVPAEVANYIEKYQIYI